MKLITAINTLFMLSLGLRTAFASTAASEVNTNVTYNSGILVLAFVGFLALVVVVQTVPAIISLYGMIKGAAEAAREQRERVSVQSK